VLSQFGAAALEIVAFHVIGRVFERFCVGGPRFVLFLEAAEKIRSRGVVQVILLEAALVAELIDHRKAAIVAVRHRNSDRVIQRDDGSRRESGKFGVERRDLGPVGIVGTHSLAVNGGDGRLQLVRTGSALAKSALDQPGSNVISKSQATMVQNSTWANGISSAMFRNVTACAALRVATA